MKTFSYIMGIFLNLSAAAGIYLGREDAAQMLTLGMAWLIYAEVLK